MDLYCNEIYEVKRKFFACWLNKPKNVLFMQVDTKYGTLKQEPASISTLAFSSSLQFAQTTRGPVRCYINSALGQITRAASEQARE